LAAIRKGVALGADFVEMDVRRSRDGRLVVIHDASVDRTTDGTGLVAEMTRAELQRLDAGDGERVPSVEEALAAASGVGVMLEIKEAGIGTDLVRAVRASGFAGAVMYASFLHAEILEIRRMDPLARTMALMECVPVSGAQFALDANAAMVGLAHDSATAEFVEALHDAGLEVMLYTVNEPGMIERGIELGADGIISDYPELVPKRRTA
jgi:glycerophosphoryl diester phosphodiesterase